MSSIRFFVEGSLRKYRELFESVCPAPMTIPRGQSLCTQCCTHGWMYYILDGLAKVYITTSDGNEQIIDFMKEDTLIGMDCVGDGSRSVVSITSMMDMRVLPFTSEILKRMILQNPELGFDLVVYYGDVLRQEYFGCHPCVNTSSIRLLTRDVVEKFIPSTGHEMTVVELTGED